MNAYRIPDELMKRVRVWAVEHDMTVREVMREALEGYCEKVQVEAVRAAVSVTEGSKRKKASGQVDPIHPEVPREKDQGISKVCAHGVKVGKICFNCEGGYAHA